MLFIFSRCLAWVFCCYFLPCLLTHWFDPQLLIVYYWNLPLCSLLQLCHSWFLLDFTNVGEFLIQTFEHPYNHYYEFFLWQIACLHFIYFLFWWFFSFIWGLFLCLPIFVVLLWLFLYIRSNCYATQIFFNLSSVVEVLWDPMMQSLRYSEMGILGMPPT